MAKRLLVALASTPAALIGCHSSTSVVDGLPSDPPKSVTKVSSGGFQSPTDAVASPDGRTFYFAAWDSELTPTLFQVASVPDSTPTPIAAGDPLEAPLGLVMSCDGATLYVAETLTGRLVAFDVTGPGQIARRGHRFPGRVVATMPGNPPEYFDSLAVTAAGNVCVATLLAPGITTIAPDGNTTKLETPDVFTTNLCFGGADLRDAWITLSGTGKLAKTRWPEPGLRLAFNA
jgi:sugar lactone lactonase YvrE